MLLSLSGFLFEDDYCSQSVSFDRFCSIAKSSGYGGVELRKTQVDLDTPPDKRRQLRRIIDNNGLVLTCLTARSLPVEGQERDEHFIRYLELCKDMGCSLLKITGDTSWLRRAAEKAEEYSVTLAANNHVGSMLETVEGTGMFFSQVGKENFRLLYDSLHLYISGQDYLGCIDDFFAVVCNILVHSARPAGEGEKVFVEKNGKAWTIAMPDEAGVQDWRGIFTKFKQLGYDGLVTVIETGWPSERREHIAKQYANFITTLWNSI